VKKPSGISERTIQYFLGKPLEELEQYRKRAIKKRTIREWDYIIWRKEQLETKVRVVYT